MNLDDLIKAVDKLHADAVVQSDLCRDAMDRGKHHLVTTAFFIHGEVAAYNRCLEILKAKQAEGRG